MIEEAVEGCEGREGDRGVGGDGVGLVGVGSEAEVEDLLWRWRWRYDQLSRTQWTEGGREKNGAGRTPLTIWVPTRVTWPLTISALGVLTTSVLPGSAGASNA